MCGFAGFSTYGGSYCDNGAETAEKMSFLIRHRGPDSRGVYSDGVFSVGFSRLKIIDLEQGEQPMTDESGRYTIVFNGEIYNYRELRSQLKSEFKVCFKTDSDTEVLLYALVLYGKKALSLLRGMYAFVLYDSIEHSLFAARDPFGIKPFYYGSFGHSLLFSSEIKAFYAHPDFKAEFNTELLPLYLQFQYIPTEEAAFRGVYRLLPGHFLEFDGTTLKTESFFKMSLNMHGCVTPYCFNNESSYTEKHEADIKKAAVKIKNALCDSVDKHLRADVPIGAFLSGGVDSALMAALSDPSDVFTVGFDGSEFDEREAARENAAELELKLTEKSISPSEFFRAIPQVQYHCDEPCANLSAVPLYLLSELASSKYKVVLSGEGADELFGGYELYNIGTYGRLYSRIPKRLRPRGKLLGILGKRISDFAVRNSSRAEDSFIGQAKIMSPSEAFSLLSTPLKKLRTAQEVTHPYYKHVSNASELQKKLYLDRHLWLPFDILNKADKMTMAHSLELRVPYLDLEVLGAAQLLSDRLLVHGRHGKYALRETAKQYIGKTAAYRKKKGFPVPFRDWIKAPEYRRILEAAFKSPSAEKFFDTDKLFYLLKYHVEGTQSNARTLYTVYAFIVWYEVYFGGKAPKSFVLKPQTDTSTAAKAEKGQSHER